MELWFSGALGSGIEGSLALLGLTRLLVSGVGWSLELFLSGAVGLCFWSRCFRVYGAFLFGCGVLCFGVVVLC